MEFFFFDLSMLLTWENLLAIVFGTLVGLFFGAVPGLGPPIAIALLIPVTFSMSPVAAILMLVAVYQGAEYGNSISAILMGIPGSAASVVTVFDGHVMAKEGNPGKALGYSLTASLVGGIVGCIFLMFLSKPLSALAMKFSDPEMFLIAILALICVGSLASKDLAKSALSLLLGLLLSTVGVDLLTGTPRYTFGSVNLLDGFNFIALLIGMFALSEVMNMLSTQLNTSYVTDTKNLKASVTWKEFFDVRNFMMRGSLIGTIIGIIPGLGASAASWISYMDAKRSSKNPERFGKGEPAGLVASDAANNAAVGGALIPLVAIGIPGSSTMAIIMGAFIIHGLQPGPRIFVDNFDLLVAMFWGFLFTCIFMYFIGKYTTTMMARLLTAPNYVLVTCILFVSLIGVYASKGNSFDLWIALIVGVIAFFMNKLDYAAPLFVLAFIFGPMTEDYFRRSLMISQGDYSVFYTRPYCIVLITLILTVIGFSVYRTLNKKSQPQDIQEQM